MKPPYITRMFPLALAVTAIVGSATALADANDNQGPAQAIGQLYELQAAFHDARQRRGG